MVIPQFRELTEAERRQGFKKIVFVRSAAPTVGRGGVETVDPKTGESTGSIDRIEFSRRSEVGGRKFKGELFVFVPARPEIKAAIRRREEKKETAELAKKEAEFEAKRIAEGKIKAKDVVLTQKGASVILSRLLKEKAQKELAKRLMDVTRKKEIETATKRIENQREKVAKLILAEQRARGTAAEKVFRQRRIEEQAKLGERERAKAVLLQFPTAGGLARLQVQLFPKKFIRAEEARAKTALELFSDLGTGKFPSKFEKAIRAGGVFQFAGRTVIGKQVLAEPKKAADFLQAKISPLTTKIFRTEILEQEQKRIRTEINKLEGKKDTSSIIQRRLLKGELATISTEIGIRKQFGEQPIETGLLFGGGALVTRGIAAAGLVGKPVTTIGAGVLGTLFVATTAAEVRREAELRDLEAGAEVLGERFAEATSFIAGGALASRFLVPPKKVKVLKAKGLEAKFLETLETKGTSAKNLQRLGLQTEVKTRVTRFERGVQLRRIKTPREVSKLTPERLRGLLEPKKGRGKLELVFGLEPTLPGKKITFPTLFREIKPTVVKPKVEPEIFGIDAEGKLVVRFKTGEVVTKDISLKRVIDPALFKRIQAKDLTVLQRQLKFEQDVSSNFRAAFLGEAKITGKVKRVRAAADIFGIDLFPQTITTFKPVRARLGFKPILAVSPIFEPSPTFLLPTSLLDIFGKQEPKKKQKLFFDVDVERDFKQGLINLQEQIRKTRQKQRPITEQITEQEQRIKTIQKPILDVFEGQEQIPITDVISVQEQEPIIDVIPDIRRDLITEVIGEPERPRKPTLAKFRPRRKPKEIKKGKFEGYNAFAKGRKGKFIKTNIRPLNKESALSSAARVVDNTISGTGKIKKVISTKPPRDKKDFFFRRNRDKFRTFRISKGKRIPLKDKFIEKRGKRLDTRGEVKQITVARFLAEQRKKRKAVSLGFEEEPRRKKRKRTVRFF